MVLVDGVRVATGVVRPPLAAKDKVLGAGVCNEEG